MGGLDAQCAIAGAAASGVVVKGLNGQVPALLELAHAATLAVQLPPRRPRRFSGSSGDQAGDTRQSSSETVNRAEHANRPTVISHAHARDLAECWQDAARAHHPVTLLARTGEITQDAEPALAYDLNLLEMASASWGSPPSIPEKQLRALLDYVRYHGPRPALENWRQLRDADFLRSIRRMAAEVRRRRPLVYEPPDDGDAPRSAAMQQQRARR